MHNLHTSIVCVCVNAHTSDCPKNSSQRKYAYIHAHTSGSVENRSQEIYEYSHTHTHTHTHTHHTYTRTQAIMHVCKHWRLFIWQHVSLSCPCHFILGVIYNVSLYLGVYQSCMYVNTQDCSFGSTCNVPVIGALTSRHSQVRSARQELNAWGCVDRCVECMGVWVWVIVWDKYRSLFTYLGAWCVWGSGCGCGCESHVWVRVWDTCRCLFTYLGMWCVCGCWCGCGYAIRIDSCGCIMLHVLVRCTDKDLNVQPIAFGVSFLQCQVSIDDLLLLVACASSLGLFCHVPLKRDQWEIDWRLKLRLSNTSNATCCMSLWDTYRSLGLFRHAPLRRDQWDWDSRLRLNDTPNAIGCTSQDPFKRERDNVVYWKTNGKINNDLQCTSQDLFKRDFLDHLGICVVQRDGNP